METVELDKINIKLILDPNLREASTLINLNNFLINHKAELINCDKINIECFLQDPVYFKPLQKNSIEIKNENFEKDISLAFNISFPRATQENKILNKITILIHKSKRE